MSILSSVEGEFTDLYDLQKELDDFLSSITSVNQYEVDKVKNEITNILADVLSLNCNDVLSCSFYMQVNQIEQIIYNVLDEKKKNLDKLINCKNEVYKLASKLFSNIYSIEVLLNSAHIKVDIEKRLLDIKNSIVTLDQNKKRICAINFLKEKNEKYKNGLETLLNIVNEYRRKDEIDFELRKELFEIFKNVSMSEDIAIQHTKVFNEDETSDIDSCEYIYWYENIFLKVCDLAGIKLPTFASEMVSSIKDNSFSSRTIKEFTSFVTSKYNFEMESLLEKLNEEIIRENIDINKQLGYCLSYDNVVDIKKLLYKIQVDKILPSYLLPSKEVKGIEHLLFDLDVEFDEKITAYRVVNDLHDKVYELFDLGRYMDLYKFNIKYKNRQVAAFRQYYIDILENAKQSIVDKYIEDIENIVRSDTSNNCSTSEFMKKIDELKNEISSLENILKYINTNYRSFSESNLKLYIDTIQKRYDIDNLYEAILNNSSKFMYRLKAKAYMEQVKKYVTEFANNDDIKIKLQKELIEDCSLNLCSDKLKNEIISKITI